MTEHDVALVKKYGKVLGVYDGPQPNLWITDLDLIKAIYVKDFDHFVDRRVRKTRKKHMAPREKVCSYIRFLTFLNLAYGI